ncbi:hypothetical protein Tco_0246199 [Tanacetum coccineum]
MGSLAKALFYVFSNSITSRSKFLKARALIPLVDPKPLSILYLVKFMLLQETNNPGTTMEEYVQFETEILDRMENESCNKLNGKSMEFDLSKNDYDCTYVPNEEWECLELKKMPSSDASYDVGEYGLMINDDDLEHMFDYLLAKDGPSFMDVEKEAIEGKKSMMTGTPSERAENLDKEFDDWARDNGFVNTCGVKMLN